MWLLASTLAPHPATPTDVSTRLLPRYPALCVSGPLELRPLLSTLYDSVPSLCPTPSFWPGEPHFLISFLNKK